MEGKALCRRWPLWTCDRNRSGSGQSVGWTGSTFDARPERPSDV